MSAENLDVATEVGQLIERARRAQESIEDYSQTQVDRLTTAVAWSVVRQDRAETLAKLAVEDGGFGNFADKGLINIAKPVGIVAALIPTTGPDATPPLKTLLALKGRNAIIVAAHPRTQRTT